MSDKTFSCNCKTDVSFIPFMPAAVKDKVELRVQIRALKGNALLDAEISVDGNAIHRISSASVKGFYYYSDRRYYTAGAHTLCIRFRESNTENWEERTLNFTIEKERFPVLSGGFVMLGPPNDRIPCNAFIKDTKAMSEDDWERYVDEMAALGIKCPEGGFTDYEASRLLETGAKGGTLGSRILRTEVALPALLGKFL